MSFASQISRIQESELIIKSFYTYIIALKIKLGGTEEIDDLKNLLTQITTLADSDLNTENKNYVDLLVQSLIDKVRKLLDMISDSKNQHNLAESSAFKRIGGLSAFSEQSLDPKKYMYIINELYD